MSRRHFEIGASVTIDELTASPYELLATLREHEPVSWVPALNAWFITRRDFAIDAMSDSEAFTVEDDRFTTAQVLGTSMLNLDGKEHERHRSAFAAAFRPRYARDVLEARIAANAERLWAKTIAGSRNLRSEFSGPLAVETILDLMGLDELDRSEVLNWYSAFGEAITALTVGEPTPVEVNAALARLRAYVETAMTTGGSGFVTRLVNDATLRSDEIPAAVAVVLFGAIETSEAMTANAFWHLLNHPEQLDRLHTDRSLIPNAINESLRLEPAAAWVDRYTTADVTVGDVVIPAGELVSISLLGANRDPSTFDGPDEFNIDRPNLAQHVTFAKGPHVCVGLHVARAETQAAIDAALDWEAACDGMLRLDRTSSSPPSGLIFRGATPVLAAPGLAS